ncbi:MAG: bifunctional UDP-N-acetylglucosamine diphosphorylase/glucosamine-1-phosphate N-acetyltransferase GlmU [Eubacteriales bacterium]|nr:bifunctional UDP-N-acetylglucosamine diphosphorylase/glucosamine-1-phosphate N-acetyltransferase GlmU [Eubacteriales bacterium]NCU26971.1 UDP-N-acetylglucosamine diphosphorylase/glucosamine-1-phosphate N-acetyltransferase [Candidatus Nomurabacteria bacterium]
MSICAVVLAAGESKRMRSKKCKFIQKTAGKPIISWIREALIEAGADEQVYIVGHMQEQVRQVLGEEVAFMMQEKQLGTGHAVMQASPFLEGRNGLTLVVRGDTPLITAATLKNTVEYTRSGGYAAVVITTDATESSELSRVVRNSNGDVAKVITGSKSGDRKPYEGDTGMYCFDTALLVSALGRMGSNGRSKEYSLTDALDIIIKDSRKVGAFKAHYEEIIGVHDKYQLMQVSKLMNRRICRNHMLNGVTITDPDSTWIEASVRIGQDAEIQPNTILEGNTVIGEDARIGPDSRITDAVVGNEAVVFNSIISSSTVAEGVHVGPYAYIRQDSRIESHTRIGHAVEVKNSSVGSYSKAPNMALITDADIGENVNYGCGCITVNFDGNVKNRTRIGDNSFIGSNSNLIAPVNVSDNTYIAAGSTITDDVPPYAMAIARSRQTVKEDWVLRRKRIRVRQLKQKS